MSWKFYKETVKCDKSAADSAHLHIGVGVLKVWQSRSGWMWSFSGYQSPAESIDDAMECATAYALGKVTMALDVLRSA